MSKTLLIIGMCFSVVVAFGALWGGAYLFHVLPDDSWAEFPLLMTSVFAGLAAVYGFSYTIVELVSQ